MESYRYRICLRGLPWDIWILCPGFQIDLIFSSVFRHLFRFCDTGHRIGINLRVKMVDGKEMVLWEKELIPLYQSHSFLNVK